MRSRGEECDVVCTSLYRFCKYMQAPSCTQMYMITELQEDELVNSDQRLVNQRPADPSDCCQNNVECRCDNFA
jgi:hypothetical protein